MLEFFTNFWYRLKCRVWHKYTTVRPKTLPTHTWVDRDALLTHSMFSILDDFVENEMIPCDYIEWDKSVKSEIEDIYYWWHNVYLKEKDTIYDRWHELRKKHAKDVFEVAEDGTGEYWSLEYSCPEKEAEIKEEFELATKREAELKEELSKNMHRLVDVSPHLWT